MDLFTVPDIVEWFTGKDRMPEYYLLNDDLIEDFENYGIKEKGCDRFIQYFYGLLPSHNKELYDKYYPEMFKLNSARQKVFESYLREDSPYIKGEEYSPEDRIFDPQKIIKRTADRDYNVTAKSNEEVVASALDSLYMFRKWSKTKQVYRIHPTLAEELANTNMTGFCPDILDNLPFKTFFIDMTNIGYYCNEDLLLGALINVIKDPYAEEDGKHVTQYMIHICLFIAPHGYCWCRFVYRGNIGKVPLKDGFSKGAVIDDLGDWVPSFLVNSVAYIASHNADLGKEPKVKHKHTNKKFNTKAAKRMLLEQNITNWNVGYVIGPKIEKALERYESSGEGTHNSPRPHIRAAHWHHYWTGPKSGEQTLIVHWIDELLVNCDSPDEIPITERRNRMPVG